MAMDGRKTILLVEDEAVIAMAERKTLEKFGYAVVHALSGEEALEIVESGTGIDLVLMDINLGIGIDGAEAAKRILARREIPVVFLSSHTGPDVVDKTEAISSYGYIVKNSGDTVLLASIRMAFRLFDAKMSEKEKHRALAHSYDLMSYIIEHDLTSIAVLDKDMKYVYVSRRFLDDYRIEKRNVIGKRHYEVFPDIPEKWRAVHRRALAGEASSADDDSFVRKDGSVDFIRWDCRPWYEADGSVGGIVLYTEVNTFRKRAEEAARLSEDMFRKAFQLSPDAININRLSDGLYVKINPGFTAITGFTDEDVAGKSSADINIWADPGDRKRLAEGLREKGSVYNLEARFRKKDGSIEIGLMSAAVIELNGEPHILSVTRGIGALKKVQEELRSREAMYRLLADNSTDAIWTADAERRFTYVSPSIERLRGYTPAEVILQSADETLTPESRVRMHEALAKTMARIERGDTDIEPTTLELEQPRKDGGTVWTEVVVKVLFDENRRHSGFLGVSRDITERKREEKIMQAALKKLRFHLENTPLAVIEFDCGYTIKSWSKKAEALFGWKAEEVLGKTIRNFRWVYEEDSQKVDLLSEEMLNKAVNSNVNVNRNYRKDGSLITCEWYNSVLPGDEAEEYSVLSLVLDITERLDAEEKARNLLREKELILKEVHHRVKNNMGIVISLLDMDAMSQKDPEVRAMLADALGRVRSMMVLYDKLYRSETSGGASAKDYFPALIKEIVALFPKKDRVRVEARIEDVMLNAKLLSPLGIIVNELITNSMKYAFGEREEAAIFVSLEREGTRFKLVYADDGPGIPEFTGSESPSGFGLQLVSMLVKQIRGTMRTERVGGTRFTVEFGVDE